MTPQPGLPPPRVGRGDGQDGPQAAPRPDAHAICASERDRPNRWRIRNYRIGLFVVLHILVFGHLYLYRTGLIRSGHTDPSDLFLFLKTGQFKVGAGLLLVWILLVPILGRVGCGWFCHMGIWQEIGGWLMEKIRIYKHKAVHAKYLIWIIPSVYALWRISDTLWSWSHQGIMYKGLHYDPTADPDVWEIPFVPTFLFVLPFILAPVLAFGTRAGCRYTCPFSMFFRPFQKHSLLTVRRTGPCDSCADCSRRCKMGIDVMGEIQRYGAVRNSECVRCLTCVQVCPKNILALRAPISGLGPTVQGAVSHARDFLSLKSEAYLLIPFLLAIACVGIDHSVVLAPTLISLGMGFLVLHQKLGPRLKGLRRRKGPKAD